jgi:hypothetical protein
MDKCDERQSRRVTTWGVSGSRGYGMREQLTAAAFRASMRAREEDEDLEDEEDEDFDEDEEFEDDEDDDLDEDEEESDDE